jgi:ribosomal protein S6--L-glutamate ligase
VSGLSGRRIQLWVEARGGVPAVNPIMQALLAELRAAGADCAVLVPELEPIEPEQRHAPGPDLVLLKTATTLALSLAVADEVRGVPFLNGARETLRAHDKAAAIAHLAAAGLPVPTTFLMAPAGAPGAWVTKPTRGVHGRGVAVHRTFPGVRGQEAGVSPPGRRGGEPATCHRPLAPDREPDYVVDDGTRLVQRWVGGWGGRGGRGEDVKVYVADDRCFAGRKRFGPTSFAADAIEPITPDRRTEDTILAAGRALRLRCFGADLRYDEGRPVIIDLNPFPGYRGFPGAVAALRREIERRLAGADT